MNPEILILKYFPPGTKRHPIFIGHAEAVREKSLSIGKKIPETDLKFLSEAALLHDIGICRVNAPEIGCYGEEPYIRHGILGAEILLQEGFPTHAQVCERHIGIGLSAQEIRRNKLPLPAVDMIPRTLEEMIVTYADLFFSKKPGQLSEEKSLERIREGVLRWGKDHLAIFEQWHQMFSE